ncbi:MAG: CBS and ACT domain-containing protein [Bacillota bacterium]|nr:CBS and ACT domain-containing protein [Bacillota bacterium]
MLIEDIMTTKVVTVTPADSIAEALRRTRAGRFRHLPVVDGERVVGVVSDRDLRAAVPALVTDDAEEYLEQIRVDLVMHPDVIVAHPLDPVEDAARLMYEHKIGCLPVVSGDRLVGIVTETDVLRSFVEMSGGLQTGSRIEIEAEDRPGVLAEIGEITRRHHVNVASIFTTPAKRPGRVVLVVRLQALDLRPIVRDLKAAGYEVRWPNPLGSAGVTTP